MSLGDGVGQRGPPEPSLDLIRKLWRVGSLFFFGDRRVKARFLLVIVLCLCAVCAGLSLFLPFSRPRPNLAVVTIFNPPSLWDSRLLRLRLTSRLVSFLSVEQLNLHCVSNCICMNVVTYLGAKPKYDDA